MEETDTKDVNEIPHKKIYPAVAPKKAESESTNSMKDDQKVAFLAQKGTFV